MYEESGDYYDDYERNENENENNDQNTRPLTIKIPLMEPLLILEYFLRSKHNSSEITSVFDLRLDEYGCWCSNLAQHGTAIQGYPIDQIDSACRRWSRCRNCMRGRQDICPVPFNPSESYSIDSKEFKCLDPRFDENVGEDHNLSFCASQCCKCDFNLASEILLSLDSYNENYVNIEPVKCRNTNKLEVFRGGGGGKKKQKERVTSSSSDLLHARSVNNLAPVECDEL